jgi:hypothetical protein
MPGLAATFPFIFRYSATYLTIYSSEIAQVNLWFWLNCVVLPGGGVVRTGYESFGETPLAPLSSMPAGPYLDGLFTQSNFGIVTRATLWLARHPERLQLLSARIPEGGITAFVDSLQQLVDRLGNGACTFSLWNGHKLNARQGAGGIVHPGSGSATGACTHPAP